MGNKKLGVIIPAYNEQNHIEDTLHAIFSLKIMDEVIVIDDGSKDNTYALSRQTGARTIRTKENKGKGDAIKKGLEIVDSDIIIFLDADIGQSAKEIEKLVYPLINNDADVTIASFPKNKGGGFGIVKSAARYYVKKYTGKEFNDVLSGQRAFKKEVINDIKMIDTGFGLELGMTIELIKKGYRVLSVDVDMYHDITKKDIRGFIHRFRQFFDINRFIFKNKNMLKKLERE
ncbi:MAG: glycosyltransferase family 2 protein [Clostridia bacterium]|nr:glycosyltransferase family 2 protein [Clostridia bacterium]